MEETSNEFSPNGPFLDTILVNKMDHPWAVMENGRLLTKLEPGQTVTISSWKNTTSWSRWSKAVADPKKGLVLTENKSWVSPYAGQYTLTAYNIDGASIEMVNTIGGYVNVPRGMPTEVPLNLWDPLILFSELVWKNKETRVTIPGTPYFETGTELVRERVPRPEAELRKILAARKAIIDARTEKEERERLGL